MLEIECDILVNNYTQKFCLQKKRFVFLKMIFVLIDFIITKKALHAPNRCVKSKKQVLFCVNILLNYNGTNPI